MSVCSCLWCTRFSRLQRHRLYGKYWMNTIVPLRLFHSATNFVMNDFIFLWFEDRFALVRLNVEQVSECVSVCVLADLQVLFLVHLKLLLLVECYRVVFSFEHSEMFRCNKKSNSFFFSERIGKLGISCLFLMLI